MHAWVWPQSGVLPTVPAKCNNCFIIYAHMYFNLPTMYWLRLVQCSLLVVSRGECMRL